MTLLTIAQDAAQDAGFTKPASVVGSSNETAIRLLRAISKSGRMLLRRHNWQDLINEHTFTTDGNAAGEYDLPEDFSRIINGTWWDETNQWPLHGPVNAQEWNRLKKGIVTVGPKKFFRIRGNKMLLDPVPGSGDTISYEYIQKNWIILASDSTEASSFASDSDTILFDEELITLDAIWRFRKAQGLDYSEEKVDAETEIRKAMGHSGGAKVLNLGRGSMEEGAELGVNIDEGNWTIT